MQSAASPSIPHSPTRQTTPNRAGDGCKPLIIAVIPEPSSPKNGRPHPTQVPTACRGEPGWLAQCDSNAHKPLTLGPAVRPVAH